jgi:hypothetical protein
MSLRLSLLTMGTSWVLATTAQNYVPNYSFEDHSSCPFAFNQVQFSTGWNKSFVNNVSPHHVDYIHSCGSNDFMAPDGFWGYQDPATGQAHVALSTKSPLAPNYRENIYAELIAPLIPGEFYTISMKVSHTDLTAGATNNLGIRLTTTPAFPIDNFSHMHSLSVISDDVNWITLTGSIIADSAYAYVGVGNFYTDANTTAVTVCSSCPYVHNEYYIDDICILPHTKNGDPVYCDIAFDPFSTIIEQAGNFSVSVQPTLVDASTPAVTLASSAKDVLEVRLLDALGRDVHPSERLQPGGRMAMNNSDLVNGAYLIRFTDAEGRAVTQRIVIAR